LGRPICYQNYETEVGSSKEEVEATSTFCKRRPSDCSNTLQRIEEMLVQSGVDYRYILGEYIYVGRIFVCAIKSKYLLSHCANAKAIVVNNQPNSDMKVFPGKI
jgi:hypothetical protein